MRTEIPVRSHSIRTGGNINRVQPGHLCLSHSGWTRFRGQGHPSNYRIGLQPAPRTGSEVIGVWTKKCASGPENGPKSAHREQMWTNKCASGKSNMPFSPRKTPFFRPHQIPPTPTRGVWVGGGLRATPQPPLTNSHGRAKPNSNIYQDSRRRWSTRHQGPMGRDPRHRHTVNWLHLVVAGGSPSEVGEGFCS